MDVKSLMRNKIFYIVSKYFPTNQLQMEKREWYNRETSRRYLTQWSQLTSAKVKRSSIVSPRVVHWEGHNMICGAFLLEMYMLV